VVSVFSSGDLVHPFDEAARRRLDAMSELPVAVEPDPAGERLGPDRRPEVHALLPPICAAFGIAEPDLHLAPGGDLEPRVTSSSITLAGGLVDGLAQDEIEALLAHACGHVLLGHAPYGIRLDAPAGGALSASARGALSAWARASELSADRAAAAYQGGADAVTRLLFRLAVADPGARAFAVRVREIQAWTATPAFARLRLTGARGS
jgi:Zn-dependent protease with chaperone function